MTSDRIARLGAAALAVLLSVVGIVWMRTALDLFSPPRIVCAGCVDDRFRWLQLLLTIGGVALIVATVVFSMHIAWTGRTWRRRRALGRALAIAIAAWTVLVLAVAWL